MADKSFNLCRFTTATTGTGAIAIGAAVVGFFTPAGAGAVNGDVGTYSIQDGANSETGRGTYSSTGPTLTRTTVFLSTAGVGTPISLSGSAQIIFTPLAENTTLSGGMTLNQVPKASGAVGLVDSLITDDGTTVTIGSGTSNNLIVNGSIFASGGLIAAGSASTPGGIRILSGDGVANHYAQIITTIPNSNRPSFQLPNVAAGSFNLISSGDTGSVTNTMLANSSVTVAGHAISLGGSSALAASDLSNGVSGTGAVLLASVIDTDATLAANSATLVPAQSAIKSYVDNFSTGLKWKLPVVVATTANITLSGEQTIDGVLTSASRVLVKNQTTGSQNGIYVSAAGAWTRSTDADTAPEITQATLFVQQGTVNANTQWTCSTVSITLGTTALTFAQISGAGTYSAGAGLTLTGNQFSLTNSSLTIGSTTVSLGGTAATINSLTLSGTTIATGAISQSYDGSVNPNAGNTQGIASLNSVYNEIAVYGNYPTSSTDFTAIGHQDGAGYLYSNSSQLRLQVNTGNFIAFDIGFSTEIGRFDAAGLHVAGSLDIAATDGVTTSALIHGSNRAIRMWTTASGSAYIEGVDNTGALSYQPLIIGGSSLDFQISSASKFSISTSGDILVNSNNSVFYSATTPTTAATAKQVQIGEATDNTAYRLSLGYYNDSTYGYTGVIQDTAGGSPSRLLINPLGGNVGIGSTSINPSATLDVTGTGKFSGSLITTGVIAQSYDGSANPNASYQGIASLKSVYNEIAVYGDYPTSSARYMAMGSDNLAGYLYTNDTPLFIQVDTGNYIGFDVGSSSTVHVGKFDASGLHVSSGNTYAVSLFGASAYPKVAAGAGATGLLINPSDNASNATFRLTNSTNGVKIEGVDYTGTGAYKDIGINGSTVTLQIAGADALSINASKNTLLLGTLQVPNEVAIITSASSSPLLALVDTTDGGWLAFSQSGIFRLATANTSTGSTGNKLGVDTSGNIGVLGSYSSNNKVVVDNGSGYTRLWDDAGHVAIYLGGAGDQQNYYRNTLHTFGSVNGASTYFGMAVDVLYMYVGGATQKEALYNDGANQYIFPYGTGTSNQRVYIGGGSTVDFTVSGATNLSGHLTVEGVTSTGATGTGKLVFDSSPTITTPLIVGGQSSNFSATGVSSSPTLSALTTSFTTTFSYTPTSNNTTGSIAASVTKASTVGGNVNVQNLIASYHQYTYGHSGTLNSGYGVYIDSAGKTGGGVIGTNIALYVASQTAAGGGNDYAIWTNAGTVHFDDRVAIGSGVSPGGTGTLTVLNGVYADSVNLNKSVVITPIAFASRPTGVDGMMCMFYDANTAVWGANITAGGGSNHVLAWYNGFAAQWRVAGA